jgi:hypothetical protein
MDIAESFRLPELGRTQITQSPHSISTHVSFYFEYGNVFGKAITTNTDNMRCYISDHAARVTFSQRATDKTKRQIKDNIFL